MGTVMHHSAIVGQTAKSADLKGTVRFIDVRKEAGLIFLQDSTQTEQKYYLETMGTGVGRLDYDQDGLMDLYFVQSAATDIYKPEHALRSALYHNNGDGTFTDVTEKAGLGGKATTDRALPSPTTKTMASPISTLPVTAGRFCTTTMGMGHLPT
jgi:VCBS repeat protein